MLPNSNVNRILLKGIFDPKLHNSLLASYNLHLVLLHTAHFDKSIIFPLFIITAWAGVIQEFKGSVWYIRERAFIEIISLKNTLKNNFFIKKWFFPWK